MKKRIESWLSVQIAKKPGRVVLGTILLFNIIFLFLAAIIISNLSLSGTEKMGFMQAAFCTVAMILDAGCIQFVIEDIGHAGVALALVCLGVVFVGMISFTGAVIGYITNYISNFIENANQGSNTLKISDHIVILNWNTRASEIINDLLYKPTKEKVVVLTASGKKEIEKEIEERLTDTIARENQELWTNVMMDNTFYGRSGTFLKHRFKRNLTVIVREGDVFSSKQLHDISIENAKSVIILGNDTEYLNIGRYQINESESDIGNTQTIKTLMQVADITSSDYSTDHQKIIVEITDDWTWELVEKIKQAKQKDEKCNIVPVRVNRILGQILSQFSLMPELNLAYKELFSNKGATFYSLPYTNSDEEVFIEEYLRTHRHALPLTIMELNGELYSYYSANSENNIYKSSSVVESDFKVSLNENYWIERKKIIILGHNSRIKDIMSGFESFRNEWQYKDSHDEILKIIVIDDPSYLEKVDWYKNYPFVIETVGASIHDRHALCSAIDKFIADGSEDTSVLILSDDEVTSENMDANALANLIYVQDIVNSKILMNPDFDSESIDVVVELIDPKHHDIVSSYSINNVVISNRYISKMITQIGEKEALFNFYTDILTYDTNDNGVYDSKEIYTKKASRLFNQLPGRCTAEELVKAVYHASVTPASADCERNPTIVLGYVKPGSKMVLFEGDLSQIEVELEQKDKLIVFSNH